MSIAGFDFGSHSCFVSLVQAGGIDTVDNEYSYRATPSAVSFTNLLRMSGNSAQNQLVTNYRNTFVGFKNLIGLAYNDEMAVQEMSNQFCSFVELQDGEIGVEAEYLGQKQTFSITQLVAVMLNDLKSTALRHTQKLHEVVISVPNYFNEAQRRCLYSACAISSFQPHAIITDSAAVAYTYVLFKSDLPDDNSPPRNVVFVDVGYSGTQVSVVAFNKTTVKMIVSIGSNTIGGRNFDFALYSKFSNEFKDKYKKDVASNRKSFLKLISECETIKKRVNAMTSDIPLKIECFMDDIDFISKTNREEFDELNATHYAAFRSLLEKAFKQSNLSVDQIHSIETVGGSSRVVALRNIIQQVFKKEPQTTLNVDEAISRGCAIQAALLSPTIKIRPIKFKDVSTLEYLINYKNKNNESKELKVVKLGDSIPTTKEIVFPPFEEFIFTIKEKDQNYSPRDVATCRSFGQSAKMCNAEKLVFCFGISTSGVLDITRSYFLENKREESAQPESLDTQGDIPSEAPPKIVKVCHDLQFEFNHFKSFHSCVSTYQRIEQEMQNKIEIEKQRASAKNSLEEFIYSSRSLLESSYKEYCTMEESSSLLSLLSSYEDWLYDDGDFTETAEYSKRLSDLESQIFPVKARYDAFNKVMNSFQNLEQSLMKYRNKMNAFKENAQKYQHLLQNEIDEYCEKISSLETFTIQGSNSVKNHPRTKLPPVTYELVDQKHAELKTLCDRFISKAENPPPPPTPQPPQGSTQTNGSQSDAPNANTGELKDGDPMDTEELPAQD